VLASSCRSAVSFGSGSSISRGRCDLEIARGRLEELNSGWASAGVCGGVSPHAVSARFAMEPRRDGILIEGVRDGGALRTEGLDIPEP